MAENQTLLVTGGSGKLARSVIRRLVERGDDKIIAATRTPERLEDLRALGVEIRSMDFDDDVSSMTQVLEGVDRMLMISTHDVGRRAEQHRAVVEAAERAKVGHLLYTSCACPNPDPSSSVVSDHFWSEHAIMASKLRWTMLRHNMYSEHIFFFSPQLMWTVSCALHLAAARVPTLPARTARRPMPLRSAGTGMTAEFMTSEEAKPFLLTTFFQLRRI